MYRLIVFVITQHHELGFRRDRAESVLAVQALQGLMGDSGAAGVHLWCGCYMGA